MVRFARNAPWWRHVLILLALVAAPQATLADNRHVQVVPYGGYRAFGGFEDATTGASRDLASAPSFGLAVDLPWDSGRWVQAWYSRQSTDVDTGDGHLDVDVEYLHFGGTVDLEPKGDWEPYFSAGIGATRFSPSLAGLDELTRFSGSLAWGIRRPLSERVTLRFELRGYITLMDSDTAVFCESVGGSGACTIVVKGSTLLQGEALVGVAFGF